MDLEGKFFAAGIVPGISHQIAGSVWQLDGGRDIVQTDRGIGIQGQISLFVFVKITHVLVDITIIKMIVVVLLVQVLARGIDFLLNGVGRIAVTAVSVQFFEGIVVGIVVPIAAFFVQDVIANIKLLVFGSFDTGTVDVDRFVAVLLIIGGFVIIVRNSLSGQLCGLFWRGSVLVFVAVPIVHLVGIIIVALISVGIGTGIIVFAVSLILVVVLAGLTSIVRKLVVAVVLIVLTTRVVVVEGRLTIIVRIARISCFLLGGVVLVVSIVVVVV